jgi:predicted Zn-dependent protease
MRNLGTIPSRYWPLYGTALTLAGMLACVTVPDSDGRKQLNFIPDAQMNAMGAQAYAEIGQKEKISRDPRLNEMITRIGRRIARASGANFDWEFRVIDDPKTVNAFCLPGGKVAVYTGILPVAKTEAALAAVMGHEVGHAVAKHGAERMSQNVLLQAGILAGGLWVENPESRALVMGALGLGAQFGVLLPYSRAHESEADKMGLRYMAEAGYNPEASIGLWERMAKLGGGGVPEFMSTHPSSVRRAEDLREGQREVEGLYARSEKQVDRSL